MKIQFLTIEEVLIIHRLLIEEFGGLHGVKDKMESLANNHALI